MANYMTFGHLFLTTTTKCAKHCNEFLPAPFARIHVSGDGDWTPKTDQLHDFTLKLLRYSDLSAQQTKTTGFAAYAQR